MCVCARAAWPFEGTPDEVHASIVQFTEGGERALDQLHRSVLRRAASSGNIEELSDAGSSSHADDLARVRELAAQDAERFLAARGRELKPGGRLFLANSAWTYIAVCDDVGEILRTLPDSPNPPRLALPMLSRTS